MFSRKLVLASITAAVSAVAAAQQSPLIEEISVIGQFVPDEKRGTDQISNVVGEEQFTRSGDSNIAESLKRVSGLSTVAGKYVYVRGLGERYATTLLNGAILPSPEPLNRVVPMDLFPTGILESVLVQKTYSAAYPGEFGGGVLQMRTKKSTDEFFWNFASTVGVIDNATFKDGYTVSGGDTDWLGIDDGFRAPSQELLNATANGNELKLKSRFSGIGVPAEQLEVVGESFNNQYTPTEESAPPNVNISTSFGNFYDIGATGMKLNYLASLDYSNSWDTNRIERNTYVPSGVGLDIQEDLDVVNTENSIDLSGIFSAGLDIDENNNVRFTSVALRQTDNRVFKTTGETLDAPDLSTVELQWVEREILSNQLQGDHYFPAFNEFVVNWRYSDIVATREAPDTRSYRYDGGEFSSRVDGNMRSFDELEDNASELGIDLTMVFYGPRNSIITPKFGYVSSEKERNSEIRRFGFAFNGPLANNNQLLLRPLEEILSPENITEAGFVIRELTRPTDSYKANNSLEAFYGQVEVNFDDRLRLTFGGRQEDFDQVTTTFDLFRPSTSVVADLSRKEFLPSFSATYIHYDHQFRLAYSETVSRPDFRELSTSPFINPETGREIFGNPNLDITSITNFDFRWEWYFGFADYVSAGIFYKEFVDPIEAVIFSPVDPRITYINAQSAENQGIELEGYKRLDFLGPVGEDFYVQGNISFIDSLVNIRQSDLGSLTSSSRPLQGQSDVLFNFQIGYEPYSGTTATLLYHYFGDRIDSVGIEGAPDLIQEGYGELNFIFIKELNRNWQVTAKAKNILDVRSEITQGSLLTNGFKLGREASIQVQYRF
ncbi:MAG: TonB-dependent receptor domain-containing protein [Pseudohongiellaceae bacterium]